MPVQQQVQGPPEELIEPVDVPEILIVGDGTAQGVMVDNPDPQDAFLLLWLEPLGEPAQLLLPHATEMTVGTTLNELESYRGSFSGMSWISAMVELRPARTSFSSGH